MQQSDSKVRPGGRSYRSGSMNDLDLVFQNQLRLLTWTRSQGLFVLYVIKPSSRIYMLLELWRVLLSASCQLKRVEHIISLVARKRRSLRITRMWLRLFDGFVRITSFSPRDPCLDLIKVS